MHLYAVEQMVQERREELHRLSHADQAARREAVPGWRRRAGRALASLAVAVAVPRSHRASTRSRVGAALTLEPCC